MLGNSKVKFIHKLITGLTLVVFLKRYNSSYVASVALTRYMGKW